MLQIIAKIAVLIFIGGIGILFLAYLLQDRLIFFPSKGLLTDARNFVESEISLRCDGAKLHGWRVTESGEELNTPLIVYYGGNAEEVSVNLAEFQNRGLKNFLMFNYRGYGNSTGKPTQSALFQDALSIFDHFVKKYDASGQPIILMGRSLGTAVAVHVAGLRKVAGVILITPFDSLANVARVHYPFLPVKWVIRHPFNSIAKAPRIKTPMLTLIAGRDEIIPNKNSYRLVEKWAGPTRTVFIPDAGHNDIHLYPEFWTAIHAFINRL